MAVPQVSSPVKVQPLTEGHSTLDDIKDGKLPNLSSESAATEIEEHNSTMQVVSSCFTFIYGKSTLGEINNRSRRKG